MCEERGGKRTKVSQFRKKNKREGLKVTSLLRVPNPGGNLKEKANNILQPDNAPFEE